MLDRQPMAKKKTTHGGARKGAGRHTSGKTEWLQLRLTPEQKAWLEQSAGANSITAWAIAGWVERGMPPTPKPKKPPA